MSIRTGSGSLNLKNPSKARLRKLGAKGRSSQREYKQYGDRVPF